MIQSNTVIFRQYQPSKALSAYIKSYWILESDYFPGGPERILPDGCTELIFHFGDKYQRITDGIAVEQPYNLLVGQIKQAIELQATGRTGMLGVRFYPWGLYPFTGIPANELADQHLATEQLFKNISHVAEQLQGVSHDEMVKQVETFLYRVFQQQKQRLFYQADRFRGIVNEMLKDTIPLSVNESAVIANMSVRQFNRKFNEVVGLSPKQFIRINRIQQFINNYRQVNEPLAISSLVYQHGYYDPAHFTHDFKDIAGVNPSQYFEGLQDLGAAMLF